MAAEKCQLSTLLHQLTRTVEVIRSLADVRSKMAELGCFQKGADDRPCYKSGWCCLTNRLGYR